MADVVTTRLNQQSAAIRALNQRNQQLIALVNQLATDMADLKSRPLSVAEQIDAIPGRRIDFLLSGEIAFDITDLGRAGEPIFMPVSQDGPFIQTHYPMFLWYPTAPDDTDNLNRWRPTSSFPLPTQEVSGDIIDIKYEIRDNGSGRDLQNEARGPIVSRPDNVVPLPCPVEWSPNTNIRVLPFYQAIAFTGNTAAQSPVVPTAGVLYCALPGYRIVNL